MSRKILIEVEDLLKLMELVNNGANNLRASKIRLMFRGEPYEDFELYTDQIMSRIASLLEKDKQPTERRLPTKILPRTLNWKDLDDKA